MTEQPDVAELVRQWLQKADNDLKTAEHTLLITEDCPFDTVCFHAQQCAEKCVKALLVMVQAPFRKTHDLEELSLLAAPWLALPVPVADLAKLTPHATNSRYPDDWRSPSRAEADWAVGVARRVRQSVLVWISGRMGADG